MSAIPEWLLNSLMTFCVIGIYILIYWQNFYGRARTYSNSTNRHLRLSGRVIRTEEGHHDPGMGWDLGGYVSAGAVVQTDLGQEWMGEEHKLSDGDYVFIIYKRCSPPWPFRLFDKNE